MGIRFRCHHCNSELHVKDFQGGRRGRCPECGGKFRIPPADAEFSLEVGQEPAPAASLVESQTTNAAVSSQPRRSASAAAEQPAKSGRSTERSGNGEPTSKSVAAVASQSSTQPQASVSPAQPPEEPAEETAEETAEEPQRRPVNADGATEPAESPPPAAAAVLPTSLSEAPAATWYVRPPAGGQYGPAPTETCIQWLIEGRICRETLVWRDDWPEWLVAGKAFASYFGEASQAPPHAALGDAPPRNPELVKLPSVGERNRQGRRYSKRRQYMWMLAVLCVLFVTLMVALIYVLFFKPA